MQNMPDFDLDCFVTNGDVGVEFLDGNMGVWLAFSGCLADSQVYSGA